MKYYKVYMAAPDLSETSLLWAGHATSHGEAATTTVRKMYRQVRSLPTRVLVIRGKDRRFVTVGVEWEISEGGEDWPKFYIVEEKAV